ncbi:MAG: hypothetical protein ABH867_04405 [Patescibacteria group bacterium]|nr:hypothetical protein [Patescibacteria group bacterium]
MKKILIITFSVLLVLVFLPVVALAQGRSNQAQSQNQVQTQNQGEDQQLQVATQEQESLPEGQDEENEGQAKGQPKSVSPRSETAREHISVVAQTVEELLTTQGAKGGIGQQVSEVAKEQQQAQQEIEGELDKLEARRGWTRKLFGPDYKAIKNLNQQMKRNRPRIRQLEQLQTQVTNQTDQAQIQEAVQALIGQNTALEEQIRAEEQVGSLLGWLFKLFTK